MTERIRNIEKPEKKAENMEGKPMAKDYVESEITNNYYEYQKKGVQISVVGRLRRHIDYWKSIGCSSYILNVIEKGSVIPIIGDVSPTTIKNNKSSRDHPLFVRKSIDELVQMKEVVECEKPPMVVNPLTVSEKTEN